MTHEYALVFKSINQEQLREVCAQLSAAGLTVILDEQVSRASGGHHHAILVSAPSKELEREAERLHFSKRLKVPQKVAANVGVYNEFTVAERHEFLDIDSPTFFLPGERQQLVWSMLQFAEVGPVLNAKQSLNCESNQSLIARAEELKILDHVVPVHNDETRTKLWKQCFSFTTNPVYNLRDYYGEEVAFYFAWLQSFTWSLIPPAFLGCLIHFCTDDNPQTVDDNKYLPLYALVVVLWGHMYLKSWERQTNEYACVWGTLSGGTEEEEDRNIRPQFKGELRISPVTQKEEQYYPLRKRYTSYLFSIFVTGIMLVIAVTVMVCSFNFQGYMSDPESPLHFPPFHRFSNPGAIFDPNGPFYLALIPVITHSMIIMQLNGQYRKVAIWLTELENHRTDVDFQNALILKRFLFEAFDCYLPLFYLAFYELDASLLRIELVALYTTDSIRRVTMETVLPYVLHKLSFLWKRASFDREKGKEKEKPVSSHILEECEKEEYEQFDDYLEMVIEFGYISLFASAFPLASLLSIICNLIEFRSDAFKLSYLTRKPRPVRVAHIGTWFKLLTVMAWLSVLTNCLIFGFSSDQINEWFPWMFVTATEAHHTAIVLEAGNLHTESTWDYALGWGEYAVGSVFAIEHILIVICLMVVFVVPNKPLWVRQEMDRRAYELRQKIGEMRKSYRMAKGEGKAKDDGEDADDRVMHGGLIHRRSQQIVK